MNENQSVLLGEGMEVNTVKRKGVFKIINIHSICWLDGVSEVIYTIKDVHTLQVFYARAWELYLPD